MLVELLHNNILILLLILYCLVERIHVYKIMKSELLHLFISIHCPICSYLLITLFREMIIYIYVHISYIFRYIFIICGCCFCWHMHTELRFAAEDSSLRPTIITPGSLWKMTSQPKLLAAKMLGLIRVWGFWMCQPQTFQLLSCLPWLCCLYCYLKFAKESVAKNTCLFSDFTSRGCKDWPTRYSLPSRCSEVYFCC